MACLTPTRIAELQADLAAVNTSLTKARATYNELLDTKNKSYGYNSGEGEQRATRRDISELEKTITNLIAQRDSINKQLNCNGLVNTRTRR